MKAKRQAVSPAEQALFLEAIRGARPLAARDRVAVPPPPPGLARVAELAAAVELVVEGDGQRYTARAPGVSHAQVAELRTGKLRVEATLDLHGSTVERAIAQLRQFLDEARRLGRRCVLIVHGKGLHSDYGAPVREAVLADLLGPSSGRIRALCTAAPADGGEGATYVLVRK